MKTLFLLIALLACAGPTSVNDPGAYGSYIVTMSGYKDLTPVIIVDGDTVTADISEDYFLEHSGFFYDRLRVTFSAADTSRLQITVSDELLYNKTRMRHNVSASLIIPEKE